MRRWRSGRPRTPPRSRRPSSSCSASSRPATWLCAPTTTKTSRSRSCRRMPTSSSSRCRWEAARRRMRFAVLGAGAIGAYVGAALARGGADVHLIARGDNLEALQREGVRVRSERGDFEAHPPATDDSNEIGPVDFVFLGLKANSYAECGPLLKPLLHENTAVVAGQNGIPWWYFHKLEGPYEGRRIEAVDPDGRVSRVIPPERAIGCVVFAGTAVGAEPSVSIEQRLEGAEKVGDHKPSTLQDLEAGKPLELAAIVDAVVELADLTGVPAPSLRAVSAASGLLAEAGRA